MLPVDDVIVIGGGLTGSALAGQILMKGLKVTVLESGIHNLGAHISTDPRLQFGSEMRNRGVIVKSGVQAVESSGDLIDPCHLDTIFKFNSSNHLGQVAEST